MDLNPVFTGPTSFRPAGTGGELKLFEQVGIKLVHGWLVDPDSPEAAAVAKTADYDSTATFIADADHTAKGQLVVADESNVAGSSRHSNNWTDEERIKIETGESAFSCPTCNSPKSSSYLDASVLGEHMVPADISWPIYPCLHTRARRSCGPLSELASFRAIQINRG